MRALVAMVLGAALMPAPVLADCKKVEPEAMLRMAALSVAAEHCWFMPIRRSAAESRLRQMMADFMCLKAGSVPINEAFVGIAVQAYIDGARSHFESWGDGKCSRARSIRAN